MPRTREEIEEDQRNCLETSKSSENLAAQFSRLTLEVALDIRDAVQKLTSSEK